MRDHVRCRGEISGSKVPLDRLRVMYEQTCDALLSSQCFLEFSRKLSNWIVLVLFLKFCSFISLALKVAEEGDVFLWVHKYQT